MLFDRTTNDYQMAFMLQPDLIMNYRSKPEPCDVKIIADTIVVATDNEGIPCTGGRLSSAAENTAREDTRPPANDTHINSGQHNN